MAWGGGDLADLAGSIQRSDKHDGEATLNSVIVPLDGSELAETVLSSVAALARELGFEVILLRAYKIPNNLYASPEEYYPARYEEIKTELSNETNDYLAKKVAELKRFGIAKVSSVQRKVWLRTRSSRSAVSFREV